MIPAERILVIDDDEDIRAVIQEVLVSAGYQVEVARDGAEALAKLPGAAPPPLILLDMMMPNMDGEAFLRALRRTPHMQDAPVVVVSGSAGVRQRASTLDVAGCLEKPFELADLLGMVGRLARTPPP